MMYFYPCLLVQLCMVMATASVSFFFGFAENEAAITIPIS